MPADRRPGEAHETLGSAISDVRPSFTSFTIAFIAVAMQSVGHRDLFTLISDTDRASSGSTC